jgi:ATP-dependent helicase HrpA
MPDLDGVRLEFDPDLPITAWRTEIADAIAAHPVVVLAGETGSGKTTQLPKICLELGRRSIAHTQPRRIAARSVAERIAAELAVTLGDLVGYQVRFTRQAGRDTRLKVMTDGVLLNEISRDRDLRRYDTIIIDEAHERSLNIDFLLGYLRRLTQRRQDLKVIITSATIDTERFAAHFADAEGVPAPVIEVSGRTYPVELRYRPVLVDGEVDQLAGITAAVTELSTLGSGDILVFLSGEREIRDAAQAITGMNLRSTEVLPLYARLSAAEQQRVFSAHPGRRIVLATNVAETSLTVPGIRYVIDTGTARISRYSARTKVQRLPIEPISQASANQRAGRCGRVAPGVCIRLYDEEDFIARPEFTEPEILRTNLASVLLQMAAADLGPMESFPFVQPPDRSAVTDGRRLLEELGALAGTRLTKLGRRLAQLPVDPRLGRMLLAGERYSCLREVLVIAAGLSIQDPRERPAEHREAADALHRRFWSATAGSVAAGEDTGRDAKDKAPPEGDFAAWLNLWDYLRTQQRERSGNGFRRMCRDEFLHFLRIREWQDLHAQLREIAKDLGLHRNTEPAPLSEVHTAILTGLLSQVGLAEVVEPARGTRTRGRRPQREYLGARGTRFAINPGSSVARLAPPLVMAAEIVETTRLWARTVAPIDAGQIETAGAHLLKRSYSEPHWSSKTASVQAYETVTLYGVPIVSGRRVGYGRIDPVQAREIFIRSALVEGLWRTRHGFFAANAAVRAEAEELQERTRRRDLVVDDQVIYDFYDERIPAEVVSGSHFDAWWKNARTGDPDRLTLTLDDLVVADRLSDAEAFPVEIEVAGQRLPLSYRFEPGTPRDGVSVVLPLAVVTRLDPAPFSWLVPGLRTELVTELIRSLPKASRRQFVPATEYAERALDWLADRPARTPESPPESLPAALARALLGLTGERVAESDFDVLSLPHHLRPTYVVTEDGRPDGKVVAEGDDLPELQQRLAGEVTQSLSQAAREHTRSGLTDWQFGVIPKTVQLGRRSGSGGSGGAGAAGGSGLAVVGYPALTDEQVSVGLTVVDTPQRQAAVHAAGLRRLVLLQTPDPTRWVVSHLSNLDKLALGAGPYASVPALLADLRLATIGELIRRAGVGRVHTVEEFRSLCDTVRVDAPELMRGLTALVAETIREANAVLARLPEVGRREPAAGADLTEQVGNLVFRGFVAATPYEHLTEFPRYLRAAGLRIDTLLANPARDRAGFEVIARCEDAYAALCDRQPPGPLPAAVAEIGWQLEELRVSLFAQSLRTRFPVSEKRVQSAIAAAS